MRVQVYRNLHKDCWSVRDKATRRVIDHCDEVFLRDCKFVVSEAGRQRVLKEKRKNVHAYIEGELEASVKVGDKADLSSRIRGHRTITYSNIKYNPYKLPYFYHSTDLDEVSEMPYVHLDWTVTGYREF